LNILVRTYNGNTVFRPDTSWERQNRDFYVPEFVSILEWAPVVFVRVSRAGRSIAERFATRYFDAVGRGLLLYAKGEDMESFAAGSCLNHTSYLPDSALVKPEDSDKETLNLACKAIASCSLSCQMRAGDLVAIETAPRKEITDEKFDFTIIR